MLIIMFEIKAVLKVIKVAWKVTLSGCLGFFHSYGWLQQNDTKSNQQRKRCLERTPGKTKLPESSPRQMEKNMLNSSSNKLGNTEEMLTPRKVHYRLSTWGFSQGIVLYIPSVCVCMHAKSLQSCRLFATRWTIAHQAPTSMGFSRQEYWSGLPFPGLCFHHLELCPAHN